VASAASVMFSPVVLGVCQHFFCLLLLLLSFCNTEWLPDSDTQRTFPVQDFYSFCSLFKDGIISSGTGVAQWLRCCATDRKVAGSILDGVIKSFRSHYCPGVDSASNRNEYQEHFLGVKAVGAQGWQPYHHPLPLWWNLGTLTSWNPLSHSSPCNGTALLFIIISGTAIAQWLRCCATNRKVAGSIPAGVIGIFHSDRTMVLGSTQPLTEMSTRSISWG